MLQRFLLFSVLLISFSSCVGTVEDPKKKDTAIFNHNDGGIRYSGAHSAVPESDHKIRIYFPSYSGDINYVIYVNGNYLNPILSAPHSKMIADPVSGRFSLVLDNLEPATKYDFTVRLQDGSNQSIEDNNTVIVSATTHALPVPKFAGVFALENLAGIDGLTKIKVKWNEAVPTENSLSGYTIQYRKKTDTTFLTLKINNPLAREAVLPGLVKNTQYIIGVRAFDSIDREEQNREYGQISTLDDSLVIFPGIKSALVPTNETGFNNIEVTWPKAQGGVYLYRIYWKENSDPTPLLTVPTFVDVTDLSRTSALIAVPTRNTTYRFAVLGCLDVTCSTYNAASSAVSLTATTTPPVAPFAGLTNVRFGIDYAILEWSTLPDGTRGAWDTYQVYTVNSSNTETLLSLPVILKTATSTMVTGLIEGQRYCFKVKSAITDPGPVYRTGNNTSVLCVTPQYVRPNPIAWNTQTVDDPLSADPDDTIQTACYNPTKDGFTVKWQGPEGEGTYQSFAIYVEEGENVSYTTPPVYSNKALGNPVYSYTFSGLNPDANYAIGIRTYYSVNNIEKYGASSTIQVCKTNLEPLIPQGWYAIMSLGSKTDGLDNNTIIPEAYLAKNDRFINSGNAVTAPFTMPVDFSRIENYFGWDPAGLTVSTFNSRGMIRLAWQDFKFQNGGNCNGDFSRCSNSATLGYNVYRIEYKQSSQGTRPPRNSNSWGAPRNAAPLKAKTLVTSSGSKSVIEFYDYNFPDGTTDLGKVYWYKVEPVTSGNVVQLLSTDPDVDYKDYVIKVILPPKNVSLIHRWMANKETCERMGKAGEIDRNNQYRCPYDGIGSKGWGAPAQYFYDIGGHILMDRFELSCNFSQNRCNNTESKAGSYQCDYLGNCSWVPYEPSNGDCIGFGSTPTALVTTDPTITTLDGATHYNRKKFDNFSCRIRVAGVWKNLSDATLTSALLDQATTNAANMPPLTLINQPQAQRICQAKSVTLQLDTSLTKTIAKRLQRKQEFVIASAPPEDSTSHSSYYNGDSSSDLSCNIKYATGTSLTILSGMINSNQPYNDRRQILTNPPATGSNFTKHNSGLHGQRKNQLDLRNFRYPTSTILDVVDYSDDNAFLDSINWVISWAMVENVSKSGPVFSGGSQGSQSTMLCLSRYGMQDMIGNVPEWSSDRFKCTDLNTCVTATTTNGGSLEDNANQLWSYKSKKNELYEFKFNPGGIGLSIPQFMGTNPIGTQTNPALNLGFFPAFGKNAGSLNALYNDSAYWMSMPTGLPVSCTGGKCIRTPASGGNPPVLDDNTLVSTRFYPDSLVNNFNYEGDLGKVTIFYPYQGSTPNQQDGSANNFLSFILGGFPCSSRNDSGYQNFMDPTPGFLNVSKHACLNDRFAPGRYSFDLTMQDASINDLGARCSTIVPEDEYGNFVIP